MFYKLILIYTQKDISAIFHHSKYPKIDNKGRKIYIGDSMDLAWKIKQGLEYILKDKGYKTHIIFKCF